MSASRAITFVLCAASFVAGCGDLVGANFDDGHLKAASDLDGAAPADTVDAGQDAAKEPTDSSTPPAPHVVLFGGIVGLDVTPSADTWTWDGTSWTRRDGDPHPPARSAHAMATSGKTVVLFGGSDDGQKPLNDTWVWDGTGWKEKHPAHVPPARSGHAMATFNGRVIMFGGIGNDTWTWDGTDWTKAFQGSSTPSLRQFGMAAGKDSLVAFGGMSSGSTSVNDTWFWVSEWLSAGGAKPISARFGCTLSTLGDRVVLFGGLLVLDAPSDETWIYDEVTWKKFDSTTKPSERWAHAATTFRGKVVIFGGSQGDTGINYNDTWTFDGTSWKQSPPAKTDPPTRYAHAMAAFE